MADCAAARERARVAWEGDFPVRGAFRFAERRAACERLQEGDAVTLEREPDNVHDSNAILVLDGDDSELGYVPREKARDIAGLLEAGAEAETAIRRLWETPDGHVVPIVRARIRRGEMRNAAVPRTPAGSGSVTVDRHPASIESSRMRLRVVVDLRVHVDAACHPHGPSMRHHLNGVRWP
jgi:hypothetical protein